MMKNSYKILGILALVMAIVWLLFQKGCFDAAIAEVEVVHPLVEEPVQNLNFPCLNDPLVSINLAAPSSVSGKPGALFGCRRFANTNCNLSVGDKPKRHRGIDLLAAVGTDVYAMYDGTVSQIRDNVICDNQKAHGNRIIINSIVDGIEYQFFFCHLSSVMVSVGDSVQRGDKIGKTGKTGNACYIQNAHLHLEIQRGGVYYEPQEFMTTRFDNDGNITQTCR